MFLNPGLTQSEEFRGLVTPLLAKQLDRGTLPAFEHMNQALKARAEHLSPLRSGL